MAKKFFRYVPDFDYVSRLSKAQNISDYVRVKNLFKRTKISEQVFNDLTYFTKYQIISDERPDNVAFKIYGDPNLDWLILIANNIINLQQEWPLEHKSYYDFLISLFIIFSSIYPNRSMNFYLQPIFLLPHLLILTFQRFL